MQHEKIVTMYQTEMQAEGAKRSLIKAGFAEHDIDIITGEKLRKEGHDARHPGFWQHLFGKTLDEEQSEVYEDAINTGGVVLTLRAPEEKLARAYSILDAHDTTGLTYPDSAGVLAADAYTDEHEISEHTDDAFTQNTREPVRTSLTGDETEEDVLRLAEERLEVGKRLVSEGTTRVRRYTISEDVSADISLHEQHADIFRRSVGLSADSADVDWEDKTIEIEETHERPVINKTAHITEEVVVRKDETDRQETVSETVRRQEVEIERKKSAASSLGAEQSTPHATEDGFLYEDGIGKNKSGDLSQDSENTVGQDRLKSR